MAEVCKICGIYVDLLTRAHLKKHNISPKEYILKYDEYPVLFKREIQELGIKVPKKVSEINKRKGLGIFYRGGDFSESHRLYREYLGSKKNFQR